MQHVHHVVESIARTSYGRLIAILASRTHDIAAAEDALAAAFLSALKTWHDGELPDNPDAWLITTARNHIKNNIRHQHIVDATLIDLELLSDEMISDMNSIPDDRLKLLFICAHPAIDPTIRTPLMLQTVLGLDAIKISNAFLINPTTMGQRLARAKTKIKRANLRFELANQEDMPDRLTDVLDAIYAAYTTSWNRHFNQQMNDTGLADEAIFLGRLLVDLLPNEPEAKGLLALMLYCESRRNARYDCEGQFIPLHNQDVKRWSHEMIIEAENQLIQATTMNSFGRYQCEAAIQSVHAHRLLTGYTNYNALTILYDVLVTHYPSTGGLVSQAATMIETGDYEKAWLILQDIALAKVTHYQPYWAVRAIVLMRLGDRLSAIAALYQAIQLTDDVAIRHFIKELLYKHNE
jgi:RNA polymerase sigma-70 factor (ECF subfamily)